MCPLSGPAPCSSPPDVHPFPRHERCRVWAKSSRKCLLYWTLRDSVGRGWVLRVEAPLPSLPPGTAPPGKQCPPRTNEAGPHMPERALATRPHPGSPAPSQLRPVEATKGAAPVPQLDGGPVPGVPGGRRGVTPAGACPARLRLCPRALGAQPGRRRAHLSLSPAAAAALRNPGRMWRKLWLRSSLGWLLVRLMEPLRRRLRKPCTRGDKRGKGRRG